MINRKETYLQINKNFGKLSIKQVEGFEAIFNAYESFNVADRKKLSYILATVWHETGKTMQPIEEYGKGKKRKYGKRVWLSGKHYTDIPHVFYGRGHTQNTWRDNYLKLTKANTKGWDFVNNPNLLLKMEQSIWATFYAMINGLYTGKKLSDYFNKNKNDAKGARRIINGSDKAILISLYHNKFLNSIK